MTPERFVIVALGLLVCALAGRQAVLALAARRRRAERTGRRILFPFAGDALSEPVLDAALRLARAERATLVPAYLGVVPLVLPLGAALPRQVGEAIPLLEAVEQRATRAGVAVDSRIERGRDRRHALRELLEHEPYDRLVVAAGPGGGFGAEDVGWLLDRAEGEVLVVRPARSDPA